MDENSVQSLENMPTDIHQVIANSLKGSSRRWWRLPLYLVRPTTVANKRAKQPYMLIATLAVAISLAAMLVAICVSRGFQTEISNRVIGFLGHIQVLSMERNASYELHPIFASADLVEKIRKCPSVQDIAPFCQKPCIIKTKTDMLGAVLKGYENTQQLSYFAKFLVRGRLPKLDSLTDEILISEYCSRALNLDTGKRATIYFVEDPPRVWQCNIVGVYETKFENFDKTYLFTHLHAIQEMNGWTKEQIGGYEIRLSNFKELSVTQDMLEEYTLGTLQPDGSLLRVESILDSHASLFDWLALQDINILVLFVLMLLVAAVNMVTVLLILVLERTHTIGLLKAFGATTSQLQLLFLLLASRILLRGLLLGNTLALVLCYSQYRWQWLQLPPAEYYVDYIPIEFNPWVILSVNLGSVLLTLLLMFGASHVISRIAPSEALRQ